jgi:hypothetical protein
MIHTFQLDDSNPKAKAFLAFISTFDFIQVDEECTLSKDAIYAIEEARESLTKEGGKSHEQVWAEMIEKYPSAFKP